MTVTATDSAGNSVTELRAIAVAPAQASTDRTPPVITRLSLTHSRFRVGGRATAQIAVRGRAHAPAPTGSVLALTISERATLAIEISRTVRRKHTVVGMLVRESAGPGSVGLAFSGRIGATALAPGAYSLRVTAIDGAGNRSRPASGTFTVVRR